MSVNDASRIVIDDSIVMLQIVASLTDSSKGIVYYRNMFIPQAPGLKIKMHFFFIIDGKEK
jgi:hypothetical protein